MKRMNGIALVALAVAYALGPMATQMLTPAVPFVHRDFEIPMAAAQTLISLSFVTIAVATLGFGVLADRFGRRSMMLAGTALFCAASVAGALAPTPELLIAARIAQAAGSAAGLALTRTVVHDVYGPERSGQVIAYLTAAMILAPMLSPGIGGVLLDHVHWRALFAFCALFGGAALVLLALHLPETSPPTRAAVAIRPLLRDFGALLREPRYVESAVVFAAVTGIFYAGQAALPYLFVEVLGASATAYGIWFGVACLAYIGGNAATGRWGDFVPRETLIALSSIGCLATMLGGWLAVSMLAWGQVVLFTPTVVVSLFGATPVALAQAQAIAVQPARSGAASGLLSALQVAAGAVVVQLIGYHHDGTPHPMFALSVACAACAVLASWRGWLQRSPAPSARAT